MQQVVVKSEGSADTGDAIVEVISSSDVSGIIVDQYGSCGILDVFLIPAALLESENCFPGEGIDVGSGGLSSQRGNIRHLGGAGDSVICRIHQAGFISAGIGNSLQSCS